MLDSCRLSILQLKYSIGPNSSMNLFLTKRLKRFCRSLNVTASLELVLNESSKGSQYDGFCTNERDLSDICKPTRLRVLARVYLVLLAAAHVLIAVRAQVVTALRRHVRVGRGDMRWTLLGHHVTWYVLQAMRVLHILLHELKIKTSQTSIYHNEMPFQNVNILDVKHRSEKEKVINLKIMQSPNILTVF